MKKILLYDIINTMDRIYSKQKSISFNGLDYQAMKKGLLISKQALSQPEDISLTPYAKNALKYFDNKDYLFVKDPATKMEAYFERETLKLLKKYCGIERLNYDFNDTPWSVENYSVDCWRNFKRGSDVRHVESGMNIQREKNFSKFYKPFNFDHMAKLLTTNKVKFQEVINILDEMVPSVAASHNWKEVNLPFQSKHTNVGYPYYSNDKRIDSKTGKSYATITDEIARRMKPSDVVNYPYIAFGRNLRKKARPILGGSRIQALVFNQLESEEISKYRESSPLFIGYNDDTVIKTKLVKLGEFLQEHRDLTCMNRDFSSFDTTVEPTLRRFIDAFSVLKAIGSKAQQIAFYRGVSHSKQLLVNGLKMKIIPIYPRIFSGEIDTNRGGGLVNALVNIYSMLHFYPHFGEVCRKLMAIKSSALWVMGDDNLLVQPKDLNSEKYSSFIKQNFGLDVSHTKGEYGLFFLQRRLFMNKSNEWIMITPFTRIIRSMISKESRKGLGPAGWTVATYMLLDQLKEWPELMIDVAKIFMKFDEYKLGTVWTVKQMTQLVAQEDKMAINNDKRATTTYNKLYDGDPLKQAAFNADGSVNSKFLEKIHKILLKAVQ